MNDFYILTQLKEMGWTTTLIKSLLVSCDETKTNSKNKSARPMKLYDKIRIDTIMNRPEFQWRLYQKNIIVQKNINKKLEKQRIKEKENQDYYQEALSILDLPSNKMRGKCFSQKDLIKKACNHYNHLQYERGTHYIAYPSVSDDFINRICVNMLKHEIIEIPWDSNTQEKLNLCLKKSYWLKKDWDSEIDKRKYAWIIENYPYLEEACHKAVQWSQEKKQDNQDFQNYKNYKKYKNYKRILKPNKLSSPSIKMEWFTSEHVSMLDLEKLIKRWKKYAKLSDVKQAVLLKETSLCSSYQQEIIMGLIFETIDVYTFSTLVKDFNLEKEGWELITNRLLYKEKMDLANEVMEAHHIAPGPQHILLSFVSEKNKKWFIIWGKQYEWEDKNIDLIFKNIVYLKKWDLLSVLKSQKISVEVRDDILNNLSNETNFYSDVFWRWCYQNFSEQMAIKEEESWSWVFQTFFKNPTRMGKKAARFVDMTYKYSDPEKMEHRIQQLQQKYCVEMKEWLPELSILIEKNILLKSVEQNILQKEEKDATKI